MEDNILGIIEQLTKHDISKAEAVKKLLFLYNVVESKPSTKAALNASVSAIYFADRSDYLSYHYEVVRSLTKLDEPTDEDIKKLFKELNPE